MHYHWSLFLWSTVKCWHVSCSLSRLSFGIVRSCPLSTSWCQLFNVICCQYLPFVCHLFNAISCCWYLPSITLGLKACPGTTAALPLSRRGSQTWKVFGNPSKNHPNPILLWQGHWLQGDFFFFFNSTIVNNLTQPHCWEPWLDRGPCQPSTGSLQRSHQPNNIWTFLKVKPFEVSAQ